MQQSSARHSLAGSHTILEADAKTATDRGMRFRICRKESPGSPWIAVVDDVGDLRLAVQQARELEAFETAVFTAGPGVLAGFLYWTSRFPEVLNTTVITHEVT